jgi:hypothetical protein
VTALLLLRKRPSGSLLAPPMFVLGAVLIGSLAVSALVGPAFGVPLTVASVLPSAVLTVLFSVLAVVSLTAVRFTGTADGPAPRSGRAPGCR